MSGNLDKKHYYDGLPYEKLVDPLLMDIREKISDYIEGESLVIDIGCGTGALCFHLAKKCKRVMGIDPSSRMIRLAKKRKRENGFSNIDFRREDAGSLSGFLEKEFDSAVFSLVLHEMEEGLRPKALQEARRIAKNIIIADPLVPLPLNLFGIAHRLVEIAAGLEHYRNFRSFYSGGGIDSLLAQSGLSVEEEALNRTGTIRIVKTSGRGLTQ